MLGVPLDSSAQCRSRSYSVDLAAVQVAQGNGEIDGTIKVW